MLSDYCFPVVTDINESKLPVQCIGDKPFGGTERRAEVVGSNVASQLARASWQLRPMQPFTLLANSVCNAPASFPLGTNQAPMESPSAHFLPSSCQENVSELRCKND